MSAIAQPSREVFRKDGLWLSGVLDWMKRAPSAGEPLNVLLAKPSDRLLVDAGLTREDLLGPEAFFRSQWSREREAWRL